MSRENERKRTDGNSKLGVDVEQPGGGLHWASTGGTRLWAGGALQRAKVPRAGAVEVPLYVPRPAASNAQKRTDEIEAQQFCHSLTSFRPFFPALCRRREEGLSRR